MPGTTLVESTPSNGQSGVSFSSGISFTVNSSLGLNISSLSVTVDGRLAVTGGIALSGYSLSTAYNSGTGTLDVTITTHPSFISTQVFVIIRISDSHGTPFTLKFYFFTQGLIPSVSNLTAKTWCDGKRIDLAWTNPAGATQIAVRRSSQGYCRFIDDPGENIYFGSPITRFVDGVYSGPLSTTNKDLQENRFYYYTIFVSFDAGPSFVWSRTFESEVEGLSIKDYYNREGDYVYALLPRSIRRNDGDSSRGTDQFKTRDYCRMIQCFINLARGWHEALLLFRDPELMPAGRHGEAVNQYGILQAQNWDYGLPAGLSLDAMTMRRLVLSLLGIFQEKGTCPSLVDITKVLTTWDSRCDELIDPICGVDRLFYFYDNESVISLTTAAASVDNPTLSVAGQLTLSSSRIFDARGSIPVTLSLEAPTVAFILDAMGTFACVSLVDPIVSGHQVIHFTDPSAKLRKEITGTGTGAAGIFTITSIDTTSYPWQFPSPASAPIFGQNAWKNHRLMDHNGATFPVTSSLATSGGSTIINVTGTPASGTFSLAFAFDPAGTTYAGRLPLFRARMYAGRFSLTYDPKWDVRLNDETKVGSWALVSTLQATHAPGFSPSPTDVNVWAKGVHADDGHPSGISFDTLTDAAKTWTLDQFVGYYLIPDWHQSKLLRIVANSTNTLTLVITPGDPGLDVLIDPSNSQKAHYVILSPKDAIRYSNLVSLLPSFLPSEMRAFVKFEA